MLLWLTLTMKRFDLPAWNGRLARIVMVLSAAASVLGAEDLPAPRALLLDDPAQAVSARRIEILQKAVREGGYALDRIDYDDLCRAAVLHPDRADLLVLPDASRLPAEAADPILAYLEEGGDVLALNTPMMRRELHRIDGEWTEDVEFYRRLAAVRPPHVFLDFSTADLRGWRRDTQYENTPGSQRIVDEGPVEGVRSLHVVIPAFQGWDTFGTPSMESPFPDGHERTVFAAKGGPDTASLSVEWVEKDGSRWIALVPLAEEWRRYSLRPEDFQYWQSVESRRGTTFRPSDASQIRFGLSASHTGHRTGRHEYWVALVGTAPPGPSEVPGRAGFRPGVRLEALSPPYKFYRPQGATTFAPRAPAFFPLADNAVPAAFQCLHPRPGAGGFDKGRSWRWQPLIEARENDAWRGQPAVLLVHGPGEHPFGVWASFAVDDDDWYIAQADALASLARAMACGVFLLDGGATPYTYFEDQRLRVGFRIVNTSRTPRRKLRAVLGVRPLGPQKNPPAAAKRFRWTFDLGAREERAFEKSWTPPNRSPDGFSVALGIFDDSDPARDPRWVDGTRHKIHPWVPAPEKHFVRAREGRFFLDGKPWRAHGVNYMPSSGIASEDWEYFERWLGRRSYDPEIIQRDLEHCRAFGFNAISVFLYRDSMEDQNLLDLLRRARKLGLKVNLSLRPGTPLDFPWESVREMIEYYRLPENDTVFAYDLAWEPMFGSQEARTKWDRDWEAWILDRYGSLENAESDWGCEVPRDGRGRVTNPPDDELNRDGPHRERSVAYRRFLNHLLHRKYSEARRKIRSIDPNHLVSFRMTEAGNPTWPGCPPVPYDFAGLAAAVDIFEPEAYGRIGDWNTVRPGRFVREYARWANPDLPMFWAEVGVSVLSAGKQTPGGDQLRFQADYFRNFYRMLRESGADGIFFWWYPGGFRYGENSDFGLINPDGTSRPAGAVIREEGARFLNAPFPDPGDTWISFDGCGYPNGVPGIYEATRDAFWDAVHAGRHPGLRTPGSGTTSADCPLDRIGKRADLGPYCYLDGAIDRVEIRTDTGWVRVPPKADLEIPGNGPVALRVFLSNTGEAAWLPGDRPPGGVRLVAQADGAGRESARRIPLAEAVPPRSSARIDSIELPYPAGSPRRWTLFLSVEDRVPAFGGRFAFTLRPAP